MHDEVLVVVDLLALRRFRSHQAGTLRECVEGALRRAAAQARRLVEHGNDKITPFLVSRPAAFDEILWSRECGDGRRLSDGRCAGC